MTLEELLASPERFTIGGRPENDWTLIINAIIFEDNGLRYDGKPVKIIEISPRRHDVEFHVVFKINGVNFIFNGIYDSWMGIVVERSQINYAKKVMRAVWEPRS